MQKYEDMRAVVISGRREAGSGHLGENPEEDLACLHSLQCGVGTAWMDVLPTQGSWELDDATVKSAWRLQLGVSPAPPSQTFYRCACDYQGTVIPTMR